jgi:Uma2 family endonuclease
MPTTAERPTVPQQRRFSVDDYYRMAEGGVFGPEDRVELLDGRIYTMTPIGSEHAACVRRLTHLFVQRAGTQALVSTQNPIRLNEASEPEPDVALLSPREDDYASRHPYPEDVFLVVEVADSSVSFDRDVKRPLYARAGIPVLWILDLNAEQVEVYSEPGDERYAEVHHYERGQTIPARALPDLESIAVDDLLGMTDD